MNEIAIREHIVKLLAHEITLYQFRQWFFHDMLFAEDDIAYDIKILFAECNYEDWTEQEMHEHLREVLQHITIGDKPSIQIETGTSSVTTHHTLEIQAMPNRANTPEQKQEIINRIHALWLQHPELRLGQLILNCFRTDFYHIEDFDLIETLERNYTREDKSNH